MPYAKVYLGDSVYAEYRDGGIVLTTENELLYDPPSNTIFMERETIEAFERFIDAIVKGNG